METVNSHTEIGSITSGKESVKQDSSIVRILAKKILYIRAIQGYSRGETIEPEMVGHICIPLKWKQFVFHRGCSFSIFGAVSRWCDVLAEQMLGQTSMGVDKSISKENEQLTKYQDPQEVDTMLM